MDWFTFNPASFAFSFLSVLFESMPFLLLGSLISGMIEVFLPSRWMTNVLPRSSGWAVAASGLLGLVFPMCECGVVPVIRRLMKKGLPVSCAVTYLLASPVVNPITAITTYAAFRGSKIGPWTMTCYRVALSYAVAVLVGLVVTRLRVESFIAPRVLETLPGRSTRRTAGFRIGSLAGAPSPGAVAAAPFSLEGTEEGSGGLESLAALDALEEQMRPSLARRLLAALQRGTNDFLDVAVFVIIGAAVASVFNTAFDTKKVIEPLATNPWTAVPVLMLLAFIVAVCSNTDAFIAGAFPVAFSTQARLAFLVFGPVFDLKLIFLYSLVFRRRFVLLLGIGLFLLIALVCIRLSVIQL